ncbi:MAG TPA: hypothetical protein VFX61_15660 [Micromonosporaceae bacterium]|nr:hypothetical protein [Micromonosporaceae bacterium]
MADDSRSSARWVGGRDGRLTYVPETAQVVPIRRALRVSVVGFAIAAALALLPWFADIAPMLGLLALGVEPSRQHRRWRAALAALAIITVAAAIGTGSLLHTLPDPWDTFLPFALGSLLGSIAYAGVTGLSTAARPG